MRTSEPVRRATIDSHCPIPTPVAVSTWPVSSSSTSVSSARASSRSTATRSSSSPVSSGSSANTGNPNGTVPSRRAVASIAGTSAIGAGSVNAPAGAGIARGASVDVALLAAGGQVGVAGRVTVGLFGAVAVVVHDSYGTTPV
jgi:hypothetical protein